MFPRTIGFGNPFQPFAVNPFPSVNPFTAAMGFGGIHPLNPLTGVPAINPYAGPYAGVQGGFNAINPSLASQFGWGVPPHLNPVVAAQLAATQPSVLSHFVQPSGVAPGEFGNPYQGVPYQAGQFNPMAQLPGGHFTSQPYGGQMGFGASPLGVGTGTIGQSPFAGINPNLLAQAQSNPALAGDPFIGALVAQQLNAVAQQQLPIRPLIGGHQFNPLLSGIGGGYGAITGQVTDPYAALVQLQLISQLAANPYQQLFRNYTGTPWIHGAGLPWTANQGLQTAQSGIPFGL